ncbi:MAG TPA: low-specificity L-threonine aldolase [Tepidiformaceae bacterium]|nr:low-specificity L-threonine aldolase [Tepidiformaceae bacterium]
MKPFIDLRSDTVSQPGPAMRNAMAAAEVGDDVFGDDPTVNRLEAMAAELIGKQAAVYVPSGTMANLISVMSHAQPGEEIIAGDQCHIFNYELAGSARVALVQVHALPNLPDGSLDPEAVAAAIRPPATHTPRTSLLCLENTHNRCGGAAVPLNTMDALTSVGRTHGLAVHLDGARIFNAAAALGVPASRIARDCDSVSFCLSKGLGCPVGSVVCGESAFIERARRNRKMLGGGMRQAGVLAAAGIYALEHHIDRIAEDHENARALASGLREYEVFRPNTPQTNIVLVDVVRGELDTWLQAFREAGVGAVAFGPSRMRMVTHLNITRADIDDALGRIDRAVAKVAA